LMWEDGGDIHWMMLKFKKNNGLKWTMDAHCWKCMYGLHIFAIFSQFLNLNIVVPK
jgi:hypothetical protein